MKMKRLITATLVTFVAACGTQVHKKDSQAKLLTPACWMPVAPPEVTDGQAAFDTYSWKMFVALNWPASATIRGEPDCKKPLSASGPKVWQTFKTSSEIFRVDGVSPGPWQSGYGSGPSVSEIKQVSKASNTVAISSHQEAVGGWLIDQQGNPTYFQMWVNRNWYNYVLKNNLYNKDNFSNSTNIELPWNAAELKSAWRILQNADDAASYITQVSEVAEFDDTGKATGMTKKVTLGLVGFHIIYKPEGYPQWIWSTFEHVDNVPDSIYDPGTNKVVPEPALDINYSYYNATATKVNQSPCQISDPSDCQPFTTPNPLTRLTPVRADAKTANTEYQTKQVQGTVLENYQLITTQWPTQPGNPAALWGDPTPTISANTTMESYIQTSSNCTNCHGMATLPGLQAKSDFSFLFGEAHSQIIWQKARKK